MSLSVIEGRLVGWPQAVQAGLGQFGLAIAGLGWPWVVKLAMDRLG